MAISTNNVLLANVHGKVGGMFVVRQRNGKTVICKLPRPYEKPATAGQLVNRDRFKKANDYAKEAIKDPEKKRYYQSKAKNGQSAFNVAFREAFRGSAKLVVAVKPEGKKVTVSVTEQPLRFSAQKPVPARLARVSLRLLHVSGYEEEKGDARFSIKHQVWEHAFREKITSRNMLLVIVEDWLGLISEYTVPVRRE